MPQHNHPLPLHNAVALHCGIPAYAPAHCHQMCQASTNAALCPRTHASTHDLSSARDPSPLHPTLPASYLPTLPITFYPSLPPNSARAQEVRRNLPRLSQQPHNFRRMTSQFTLGLVVAQMAMYGDPPSSPGTGSPQLLVRPSRGTDSTQEPPAWQTFDPNCG